MALGGHSIPINRGRLIALHIVGVISDDELQEASCPGWSGPCRKNKGVEVGSLLHQLGVEVGRNPYGPNARKLLLEIDPNCKDRLPKRHTQSRREPPAEPPKPARQAAAAKRKRRTQAAQSSRAAKTPPRQARRPKKPQPPAKPAADQEAGEAKPRSRQRRAPKKPTTRQADEEETEIRG